MINHIQVILHDRNVRLMKFEFNGGELFVNLNDTDYSVLKYSIVISKFVFKPSQQCFDGQTRERCVDKCIIESVVKRRYCFPMKYLAHHVKSDLKPCDYYSYINDTEFDPSIKCKRFCDLKTECYK